ncbi:MAG: Gx transporter family protein [Butyrivibrio sp.]|nr:Gx transporter family protein [Butyrivibrio sp.]
MTKKIARSGLLLSIALILSYIESLFPFFYGIPGMKLGLPNMAIVLTMYLFGNSEALIINILRIIISGFLFGNLFGILFSICGALISFLAMLIVKKIDLFSIYGVSVTGGVFHNIAQLFVAAFIVKTSGIIYYMPFLILGGVITGFINGIVAGNTGIYLKKYLR